MIILRKRRELGEVFIKKMFSRSTGCFKKSFWKIVRPIVRHFGLFVFCLSRHVNHALRCSAENMYCWPQQNGGEKVGKEGMIRNGILREFQGCVLQMCT